MGVRRRGGRRGGSAPLEVGNGEALGHGEGRRVRERRGRRVGRAEVAAADRDADGADGDGEGLEGLERVVRVGQAVVEHAERAVRRVAHVAVVHRLAAARRLLGVDVGEKARAVLDALGGVAGAAGARRRRAARVLARAHPRRRVGEVVDGGVGVGPPGALGDADGGGRPRVERAERQRVVEVRPRRVVARAAAQLHRAPLLLAVLRPRGREEGKPRLGDRALVDRRLDDGGQPGGGLRIVLAAQVALVVEPENDAVEVARRAREVDHVAQHAPVDEEREEGDDVGAAARLGLLAVVGLEGRVAAGAAAAVRHRRIAGRRANTAGIDGPFYCNLSSTDVPLMPRCSTSILLHSAGDALERPTARTRYIYITYHTTLHYIPHDENTAAGRPWAGGWRRGARRPVVGGGALVNTEKQKTKPKANKLSKRDAPRGTRPPRGTGGASRGSSPRATAAHRRARRRLRRR